MPHSEAEIDAIRRELKGIYEEAARLFSEVVEAFKDTHFWDLHPDVWSKLAPGRQATAIRLRERLKPLMLRIIEVAKHSPLLSEADQTDLQIATRKMSAALHFKEYRRWEPEVLHDEGTVLGVRAAGQSEVGVEPRDAVEYFRAAYEKVLETIDLLSPTPEELPSAITSTEVPTVRRYRPNTAFIMMWISDEHPELEDVKNCFKEVFKVFGIAAVRSDEIEHGDVITKRILDEIATSEYLIADLTGERPSVYYEVGYAHATGKRPILYRKKGTPLHFDLAVHNVPEYENITDLKQKLQKRLSILTNRELKE
ncbi:MAG: hypothetical protein MUP80_15785 [Acidobacteriia bacterium]|nr:hypothetical protein [Terriglobia bacterium]